MHDKHLGRALVWALLFLSLIAAPAQAVPNSDHWQKVREGASGYTAVQGQEVGELIQASGEIWRRWRNGPLALAGEIGLSGVVALLGLVYLLRGPIRLTRLRTGVMIPRWSLGERILHWTAVALFLLLMLTGLSLLYGRRLLLPLLGYDAFSVYLSLAKWVHNLLGPLFFLALGAMTWIWLKDNLWQRNDWHWLRSLGGVIGTGHPPAGRFNAGEKLWFWLLLIGGSLVCFTGLVLDFPLFGLEREGIQLAHIVHLASALIVMVAALGHIYLGSLGTEGALEGMVRGKVDLSWARQHHELWLRELEASSTWSGKARPEVVRPDSFFKP